MPRDKKVSHEKIIQAAKEEFSEYSYDKASMRRIGQRCGLTAAALYRHFPSKEELFNSLVEPVIDDLRSWILTNIEETEARIEKLGEHLSFDQYIDIWKDVERRMLSEVIYPNADFFAMMISGGSSGEISSFIDRFVAFHLKRMSGLLDKLRDMGCRIGEVSEDGIKVLIQSYCNALFEPVAKGKTLEEAQAYYKTIETFYRAGWKHTLGLDSPQTDHHI